MLKTVFVGKNVRAVDNSTFCKFTNLKFLLKKLVELLWNYVLLEKYIQ